MLVNTKTWFDGTRMCKKGEPYTGSCKKGHFEEVGGEKAKEYTSTPFLKSLKDVLMSMDHEDDKLWTNLGLPQVKEVENLLGQTVSRDQINDAFPGFKRDMKPLGQEKTMLPPSKK